MTSLWSLAARVHSANHVRLRPEAKLWTSHAVRRSIFKFEHGARMHWRGLSRGVSTGPTGEVETENSGEELVAQMEMDIAEQSWEKSQIHDFLQDQPFFTDYPFDKARHLRQDRNLMFEMMKSEKAKIIFFHKNLCLFTPISRSPDAPLSYMNSCADGSQPISKPVILQPLINYKDMIDNKVGTCFLGLDKDDENAPVFAASIKPELNAALAEEDRDWTWKETSRESGRMSRSDGALMAFVNGMMDFHVKHVHDGRTGQKTGPMFGGHGRAHKQYEGLAKTPVHLKPHVVYPRLDPAVIVLVLSGEYCLLGRKKSWALSRYSLLAGFAEVGETLEQTCVREVHEESDVKLDQTSLKYTGSQPWPFPHSLMIGFEGQIETPVPAQMKHSFPYTLSPYLTGKGSGLDRLTSKARSACIETNVHPEEIDRYLGTCLPMVTPEKSELADARWFHVDFLMRCINLKTGLVTVPGAHSMARRSLETWFRRVKEREDTWPGGRIPEVVIDSAGRFKYILIRVSDDQGNSRIVVRGTKRAAYHINIKQNFDVREGRGLKVDVLGGGRIEHDSEKQTINIYGYSSAYGPAVHEIAGVLCQRRFPYYDSRMIKVSYDGY